MSFADLLGMQVISVAEGTAHLRALVGERHVNMLGTAHGGFLYALADEAFALASNSRDGTAVALSVHMDYFAPARPGDLIEAVATEESLNRRVATYRVELRRAQKSIALFTGTVYRMPAERS